MLEASEVKEKEPLQEEDKEQDSKPASQMIRYLENGGMCFDENAALPVFLMSLLCLNSLIF